MPEKRKVTGSTPVPTTTMTSVPAGHRLFGPDGVARKCHELPAMDAGFLAFGALRARRRATDSNPEDYEEPGGAILHRRRGGRCELRRAYLENPGEPAEP